MNKIREITHSIKQLEVEQVRMYDTTQRINKIHEFTRQKQGAITKLDNSLKSFVFKMISVSPSEMVYCVAGSKNYSDAEFSERRKDFLTIDPIATGTYYCEKYDKKMNYRVVVI